MAFPWLAAASVGIGLWSGAQNRKAAKDARAAEEAFLKKKYEEYDIPSWMMSVDKLEADWTHKQDGINIARANENLLADYKDANARAQYNHALKIHQIQKQRTDAQYAKSEELYNKSLGLNERSADAARSDLNRKWDETVQAFAYEDENLVIQNVLEAGQQRARGRAGVTAQKTQQARLMELGTDQAINLQSLMSAGLQQDADLRDIQYQKDAADMQADARRMLEPIEGPEPIAPLLTPRATFQNLRLLDAFDYGVPPIEGVATTQVPSWGSVLANAAGAGLSAYANYSAGQSSFDPNYGGTTTYHTDNIGSYTQWTYNP
tara:strand:- start:617 stop:1576 length:960 start_codon:yes stop_codon:yes gene_type:complete